MDWKDVQTLIYNPPVYGQHDLRATGPTYRVKGGELQLAFKATDNLTLSANLSQQRLQADHFALHPLSGRDSDDARPIRRRRVPASRRCARATKRRGPRTRWVRSARSRRSRPSCSTICALANDWDPFNDYQVIRPRSA